MHRKQQAKIKRQLKRLAYQKLLCNAQLKNAIAWHTYVKNQIPHSEPSDQWIESYKKWLDKRCKKVESLRGKLSSLENQIKLLQDSIAV